MYVSMHVNLVLCFCLIVLVIRKLANDYKFMAANL